MILGLSSGLAPGPLLTLVLSEALRYGWRAGTRVALAPLITDVPIVIISLFAVAHLARSHHVLGAVSLFGAGFVAYLGYETFFSPGIGRDGAIPPMQSLRKGVVVNLLNPHPYLFWITVGSPMVIRAYQEGVMKAASFMAGFYLFLVGSKVVLSVLVGRTRHLILGRVYSLCMKALGVLLWFFAALLAWDSARLLGS